MPFAPYRFTHSYVGIGALWGGRRTDGQISCTVQMNYGPTRRMAGLFSDWFSGNTNSPHSTLLPDRVAKTDWSCSWTDNDASWQEKLHHVEIAFYGEILWKINVLKLTPIFEVLSKSRSFDRVGLRGGTTYSYDELAIPELFGNIFLNIRQN